MPSPVPEDTEPGLTESAPPNVDTSSTAPISPEPSRKSRVPVSCAKAFDALYFCYSPVYQGKMYYQFGELDDCRDRVRKFRLCAMSRFRPSKDAEELYEQAEKEKPQLAPPVWELREDFLERTAAADEAETRARESEPGWSEVEPWWK